MIHLEFYGSENGRGPIKWEIQSDVTGHESCFTVSEACGEPHTEMQSMVIAKLREKCMILLYALESEEPFAFICTKDEITLPMLIPSMDFTVQQELFEFQPNESENGKYSGKLSKVVIKKLTD